MTGDFFALKKAMDVLGEAELSQVGRGGRMQSFDSCQKECAHLGTKFTKLVSGGTKSQ